MTTKEKIVDILGPQTIILFTTDSKDRIRIWGCSFVYQDDIAGIHYTDAIEDGKIKEPTFKAAKEKNVGKKNYISVERQAELMVEQEVGKKLRNNYFYTEEEAKSNKLFKPMLAHKYEDKFSKMSFPVAAQPKLDGARCIAMWKDGEVKLYSRSCKEYVSMPHISEQLKPVFEKHPNIIIDGEAYNHSLKSDFEEIMSLIRQTKPTQLDFEKSAKMVQFHVYDLYDNDQPDLSFTKRFDLLIHLLSDDFVSIQVVVTKYSKNQEELDELYAKWTADGYEGQMVRAYDSVYKVDGRSADLLKRKEFHDAEFEIVEFEEGEANWTGRVKRVHIKLPNGKICGCGIRGSYDYCEQLYKDKDSYIGKKATVRYFEETKDGMLRFPVVTDIARHDV